MEEISFRLANDPDIERINAFYNTVYKSDRSRAKFDWEFNSSPAGKAIYVIAELNNEVIGTQCVIPYYIITAEGTTILSGKSEDTLVSPVQRGKNIFEKMYALLIQECKAQGIQFIWGFTYAAKPFLKLGFQVPFRSRMGLLVLKPLPSARYFSALSAKNTAMDKLKIFGLSFLSWAKAFKSRTAQALPGIDFENTAFNTADFNYLNYPESFGIHLDASFLDYRIHHNPYNANYATVNYRKNGQLLLSMVYHISAQGVGYLVHLHIAKAVTKKEFTRFIKAALRSSRLASCNTLRFWGFAENEQNRQEIDYLSAAGFTFINRGISFVWLPLNPALNLDPRRFVLSRMASQGTD